MYCALSGKPQKHVFQKLAQLVAKLAVSINWFERICGTDCDVNGLGCTVAAL